LSIIGKLSAWLSSLFGEPKSRVINLPFSPPLEEPPQGESQIEAARANGPTSSDEPVTERPPARIDRRAILKVFDASRPISGRSQLFGRQREIESLLFSVFDFHQHAIVYGARGSGKTSVARVFGDFADQCGAVVLYFPCEPEANFSLLMGAALDNLPPGAIAAQERANFERRLENLPAHFGPSAFVDLVAQPVTRPVVLILDEFDRITDEQTKTDIAVAMKLLSDTHAAIRIMLVGIASSVEDILKAHPSLRRHISVVRIGRIEPISVNALIDHGASAAGVGFSAGARALIERVSVGSPYHVRLLCRQAALKTIMDRKVEVDVAAVRAGVAQAFDQWAGTSPSDAERFLSLSLDVAAHQDLEDLAREAARNDFVVASPRSTSVLARLGDSITQASSDPNHFVFADSLAPQFLIASIVLAQRESVGMRPSEGWVNVATR
jgi:chloramphenicol 3-O-phosphotransferase